MTGLILTAVILGILLWITVAGICAIRYAAHGVRAKEADGF